MEANKKRLKDDFNHRCAYCDDNDYFCGGPNRYQVDHFAPQSKFGHLKFTYENLFYSCAFCNLAKSDKWVGKNEEEPIVGDKGFVSPCTMDYTHHLARDDNGRIISLTPLGHYMWREMKLFLERHRILFSIDLISGRRMRLKQKIQEEKEAGKDTTVLENICGAVSDMLCNYYEMLHEDDQL